MLTAAVMTFGGVEFKTKGPDDQTECELIGPDRTPTQVKQLLCVVLVLLP